MSDTKNEKIWTIEFEPEKITIDNFYTARLIGQEEHLNTVTEDLIQMRETELGIRFPQRLRELYLKQNGGDCHNLWVPKKPNPTHSVEDWHGAFCSGYEFLNSIEMVKSLYDYYLSWYYEETIAQDPLVPKDSKNYFVLCKRYSDVTFLDYSQVGEPRVGVVEFENQEKNSVWFATFDDFFQALRRGRLQS